MDEKLVFVYNGDSGFFNTVEDYFHKIIKPLTYQCNLCAVTYGNLGMKKEWKEFIEGLDIPVEFLHRDEFKARHSNEEAKFPSAFFLKDSKLSPFITREEMIQIKTLDELIIIVGKKLIEIQD